jgi:hypothetical protein
MAADGGELGAVPRPPLADGAAGEDAAALAAGAGGDGGGFDPFAEYARYASDDLAATWAQAEEARFTLVRHLARSRMILLFLREHASPWVFRREIDRAGIPSWLAEQLMAERSWPGRLLHLVTGLRGKSRGASFMEGTPFYKPFEPPSGERGKN